jgi:CubicO group peptidase (beta-lactamase class C family)
MYIHPPESLGFSSARLARIQTVMQRYIDDEKIAGVVTLIARRGKVAHFEVHGMADINHKLPMQPDSIFRILTYQALVD